MERDPRVSEPPCDRSQWDWVYVGRCPVCRTSIRADDEFIRRPDGTFHAECHRQGSIEREIE